MILVSINALLRTLGGDDTLRDFAHGSRMFVDGDYRLAPKRSFLFHTVFYLNVKPDSYRYNSAKEIELSMLVKNVQLPQLTPQVDTKNRYNRKTNIQTAMTYNPVSITFHDDRNDVVRDLWEKYYTYYFNDIKFDGFQFDNNPYESTPRSSKWGLDKAHTRPFMNKIEIFSMNQKKFSRYTLINPIIASFNHGTHDYSENGSLEHQMMVNYESVSYGSGYVNSNNVRGFADIHYDNRPSPLSIGGGGTSSIFGPGGFLQSGNEILGDLNKGNVFGAAFKSINVYQNLRDANFKSQIKSEGRQFIKDVVQNASNLRSSDFSFPVQQSTQRSTSIETTGIITGKLY